MQAPHSAPAPPSKANGVPQAAQSGGSMKLTPAQQAAQC